MNSFIAFDIHQLFDAGYFSNQDYYFARTITRIFNEDNALVSGACALVSRALSQGHICIDIPKLSGTVIGISEGGEKTLQLPEKPEWMSALFCSSLVSSSTRTPLVLDGDQRLYLSKYFDIQHRLARNIASRHFSHFSGIDPSGIDLLLDQCFSSEPWTLPQKKAVKNALVKQFTIISGGPGTGKTHVTGMIKHLFTTLFPQKNSERSPEILCVAPTGKAAARMENGSTIHAVLKPVKGGTGFYHDKDHPLIADMVIIDEASMIDILLLTRLLEAIPLGTHVVLLGDRHQLAPVQAGSVFSEICSAPALADDLSVLEYNFRSRGKTGIEALARAINENDEQTLEQILTGGTFPDVVFDDISRIHHHLLNSYTPFATEPSIEQALDRMDDFRVLCAHNSGRYGTLQINHVCEKVLRSNVKFDIKSPYLNQIVMVTANDYKKGLFNGDTGVLSHDSEKTRVYIKNQENHIRRYRVSDLPGYETAFAITIHKSQGSEFKTVLIPIPDRVSPVMTRQLLYTGVTRAKEKVIIAGDLEIIKKAMGATVTHLSGLTRCLETYINDHQHFNRDDT